MSNQWIGRVLLALALATPLAASALDIKKKDDVVFISGDVDPKNNSELKEALVGAKGLVVGQIKGGGEVGMIKSFGTLIANAGVPTVVSGPCGFFCTYVFMSGKERLFGTSGSAGSSMVLISKIGLSTNGGLPTPWEGNYALLSSRLSEAMPRDMLRKYVENNNFPMGIVAFPPTAEHPEGVLMECTDVTKFTSCMHNTELTPLKAGIVTSAEPFVVPPQ